MSSNTRWRARVVVAVCALALGALALATIAPGHAQDAPDAPRDDAGDNAEDEAPPAEAPADDGADAPPESADAADDDSDPDAAQAGSFTDAPGDPNGAAPADAPPANATGDADPDTDQAGTFTDAPGDANDSAPAGDSGTSGPPMVAVPDPLETDPGSAVMRDASVTIRSFTPEEVRDNLLAQAEAKGAWLHASDGDRLELRVPAAVFDDVLEIARGADGGDVVDEQVGSDDASLELATLQTQIAELEASRQRVKGLLATTSDVTESLDVETELRSVTQELEQHQGRLRFVRNRLRFAPVVLVVSMKARPRVERASASDAFPFVRSYGVSGLLD